MTQVVIHPSYGNADVRGNWQKTLDQEVDFQLPEHRPALTSPQLAGLESLHPHGKARFWGTTANHDAKMSTLRTGDIVLFTGASLVRAIGEVGCSFRNAAFADTMWKQHPERGSYQNVYSLLSFEPTTIPYREIWDLPGFNVNDNFMGVRFLDREKSEVVIEGLGIDTETIRQEGRGSAGVQMIPPEAMHTASTTFDRPAGTLTVNRSEALLVKAYKLTLNGVDVQRLQIPGAGVTDLHVTGPDGVDIVEAKRDSSHPFVREALGQLLDYVAGYGQPADRLTALFPSRPAENDVDLLRRYGIDCVYPNVSFEFDRIEAPPARRHHVWNAADVTPS